MSCQEPLFLSPHTKAEALRKLWVEFDLTLQCVGHFPPSGHGMHFSREQILQAAQLGLASDLDLYNQDDYGHEILLQRAAGARGPADPP